MKEYFENITSIEIYADMTAFICVPLIVGILAMSKDPHFIGQQRIYSFL